MPVELILKFLFTGNERLNMNNFFCTFFCHVRNKAVMLLAMMTHNVIGAFRSVYCHS